MPTFEYKADAATPCLTLIPAPVTLEYTHGTAMIGSLVTIEKRIPEYAVTEDADETWETLPIEQLSSELERYCGVAVRTRRVLTATDEADAGANAAEKARDAGVGAGAGAGAQSAIGVAVLGGMLTGTFLCIFFVPVFYALIIQISGRKKDKTAAAPVTDEKETNHA